ncbi:MAG TPA: DUF4124 domain-containing protein [Pseudoxanthomonas sp.]
MPLLRSLALLSALLLVATAPAAAQEVTIYRCIGAGGKLTLRDSPCAKGETQEVRSMQRPKDPAPRAAPAAKSEPPVVAARPQREVQIVYRAPPRPMYECMTPDDKRYTSENGEGNPRWVPLWTLGYPTWPYRNHGPQHPDRPDRPYLRPAGMVPGGGTWIRDECHPLPQQEVCARLSDRRYEIMRRYNSANQSERRQLDLEQRGIDARLSNDCGIN